MRGSKCHRLWLSASPQQPGSVCPPLSAPCSFAGRDRGAEPDRGAAGGAAAADGGRRAGVPRRQRAAARGGGVLQQVRRALWLPGWAAAGQVLGVHWQVDGLEGQAAGCHGGTHCCIRTPTAAASALTSPTHTLHQGRGRHGGPQPGHARGLGEGAAERVGPPGRMWPLL